MSFRLAHLPNFVVMDAAALLAELIAFQLEALRRSLHDSDAYSELVGRVFEHLEPIAWIQLPPAEIARGITTLIREVGLFVILDDDAALAALAQQAVWQTRLPPVPAARPGPLYTPSRRQQLENRAAFMALVHRAAAIAFAERLPSISFAAPLTSRTIEAAFTAIFDSVIAEASLRNDGTVRTLRRIETTGRVLINVRHGIPQEAGVLVLSQAMPSLVCAHYAYREARQAQLLRDANPVAHPNFMPVPISVPPWP